MFLRTPEHHEGILFLTINRLTIFDVAFKLNIHLALRYSQLSQQRRKALWKNFIECGSKNGLQHLPKSAQDNLSKIDLNDRQIENAIRIAKTLAKSTNSLLDAKHIKMVLEASREIGADFNDTIEYVAMSPNLSCRSTVLNGG